MQVRQSSIRIELVCIPSSPLTIVLAADLDHFLPNMGIASAHHASNAGLTLEMGVRGVVFAHLASTFVYANILLSEFRPVPLEGETVNQVELSGEPGTSFTGFLILVESDGNAISKGDVDEVETIDGVFDASGLLVFNVTELEKPTHTYVVTDSFTGIVDETDLDTDDDGVLDDLSSLGTIFDAVRVSDRANEPQHGSQLGGQDLAFVGGEPQLVFRNFSVGEWFQVLDGQIFSAAGTETYTASQFTGPDPMAPSFGLKNPLFDPVPTANPTSSPTVVSSGSPSEGPTSPPTSSPSGAPTTPTASTSPPSSATASPTSTLSTDTVILLSEFRPVPLEGETVNQVELSGEPGTSFTGFLILVESDGNAISKGDVDEVETIDGVFDANGLLVFNVTELEKPTHTYVVTDSFTGIVDETDLDTDDDGVLDDLSSLGTIFDAVRVSDRANEPQHGSQLGGQDLAFVGGEPQLVFRNFSVGEWFQNPLFDPVPNANPTSSPTSASGDTVPRGGGGGGDGDDSLSDGAVAGIVVSVVLVVGAVVVAAFFFAFKGSSSANFLLIREDAM
eukprot:scaffold1164_cov232-Pinguiococcus_pyrenoidosus.AAC.2